ncbi:MAG: guanylate kinase [Bacteroidales bacterium]
MRGKLIIFSAPSGAGKTSIVKRLLNRDLNLEFSISACSREKRNSEIYGQDYYFLTVEDFKRKIDNDEFVEWEEVYPNHFYGTLKSEVERIRNKGSNLIFDVDVFGGLNLKKLYKEDALAIFVMPPSLQDLEKRLINRSSEEEDKVRLRVAKAEAEINYASHFDKIISNLDLDEAVNEAEETIREFLNKGKVKNDSKYR